MKRPTYIQSVQEDRPRTVYFYATSHCNSNCSYCVFRKSNGEMPRQHLPLPVIKEIWGESEILKTCGVVVQGGEFTLHPEAKGIMEYFKSLGLKVTLLTNAVVPSDSHALIALADQVTISLDGPKHDRSRGVPGNLQSVKALLATLIKSGHEGVTLQITLGPWNAGTETMALETVAWFVRMCDDYGALPRFNLAADDGLLGTAKYAQKDEALTAILGWLYFAKTLHTDSDMRDALSAGATYIRAAMDKSAGGFRECVSTSIYTTIGEDGSVWLCQGLNKDEAVVGNLLFSNFDAIWASSSELRIQSRVCQKCSLSCQLNGDIAYERELKNERP